MTRLSNFAMGAILGKGFPQAQATLVLWTECTSACGKSFPKIVPMAKLHSLLACAFIMSTYNNLLLKAKGRKKLVKLQYVIIYYGEMIPLISFHHSRQIYVLWWNDTLWFHFTIVVYYILQFHKFLSYKDKRRKEFFTMATLLMPLLENEYFIDILW